MLTDFNKAQERKPPVLFQHGLFDSAFAWIIHHPEKAPAFLASNAGYDVWLINSRGSGPSRHHLTMDPDNPSEYENDRFWHFDTQDMGEQDLPTIINFITQQTGY